MRDRNLKLMGTRMLKRRVSILNVKRDRTRNSRDCVLYLKSLAKGVENGGYLLWMVLMQSGIIVGLLWIMGERECGETCVGRHCAFGMIYGSRGHGRLGRMICLENFGLMMIPMMVIRMVCRMNGNSNVHFDILGKIARKSGDFTLRLISII